MTEITRILSTLVGRTVIDETGVTGPVQFRLQYHAACGAAAGRLSVGGGVSGPAV